MYEGIVQDLIDELGRLPGVGPKSAQRIAFHLLQAEPVDVRRLADVLVLVKEKVRFCTICFNVSEDEQCRICQDPRRDAKAKAEAIANEAMGPLAGGLEGLGGGMPGLGGPEGGPPSGQLGFQGP